MSFRMYMLDTDTVSLVIRNQSSRLDQQMRAARAGTMCISVITRAELLMGVALKPESRNLAQTVGEFVSAIPSLPWDDAASSEYARIAAQLQVSGQPIGIMDTLIAAHALAVGAVLVTHNFRHFSRVPGLRLEDWLEA
jgi:tRNA(fMet)-specific endonuclease VapC